MDRVSRLLRKVKKDRPMFLAGLAALAAVFLIAWPFRQILWEWEQKTIDYRFRLRGPIAVDPGIVHVDIDDDSLSHLGPWPWKRSTHAGLIRSMSKAGFRVQIFDIVFNREKDPQEDAELIEEIRRADSVYLSAGFELQPFSSLGLIQNKLAGGEDPLKDLRFFIEETSGTPEPFFATRVLAPFPKLVEAAKGVGHISATPDPDGVFRRVPLVILYEGRLLPSLTLSAVIDYLDVAPSDIAIVFGKAILLNEALFPGTEKRRDIEIPINRRGEILINYAGPWDETFPHYSVSELLGEASEDEETLKREFQGKMGIVGFIASGMADIGPVPIETSYPLNGIHSTILNSIVTQQFLYEICPGIQILIILALVMLLLAGAALLKPGTYVVSGVMLLVGYTAGSFFLFKENGLILNLIGPWFSSGVIIASTVLTRYSIEEKERGRLRSAFGLYLSPEILKQAMEHPEKLSLGGKRKELTVLFSDIVGFSTLSDKLEPEETQTLLNEYFEEMTAVVFQYGGTIDKFIGDGLMVLWGDPLPCQDHAVQAVKCAIEMQNRMGNLRAAAQTQGKKAFEIRIGINTGWMTVGNMGSKQRMNYTVVGNQVNLAQRLESSARPGGIMVSARTEGLLNGEVVTEDGGEIRVKGFHESVRVHHVLSGPEGLPTPNPGFLE